MKNEPLLQGKDSMISVKSSSSRKNKLQEEYQIKKKEYIKKYGFVSQDPIDQGNCFSNFFIYWAYRIVKLSNLVNIESSHLGKFNKDHSSASYFRNLMIFWQRKGYKKIKKCPLLWTSLRINLCQLIFAFFLALISSFFSIANLYLFRLFINIFLNPSQPLTKRDKYIGGIYLIIRLIMIILNQKLHQYLTFLGNKSFLELKNLKFK